MEHRHVVRLTVVDLEQVCPYGRGLGQHKLRRLADCFMDSATPGHFCSHPLLPGQRCDRVADARKRTGWRTYKMVPLMYEDTPTVEQHRPEPRLIYLPLNLEGTEWMALDIHSGRKKAVDLTAAVFDQKMTGAALVTTRYTVAGENINTLEGWQQKQPKAYRADCPSCEHAKRWGGCHWHRSGLPYPHTGEQQMSRPEDFNDMTSGGRGNAPGKIVSPSSKYFPGSSVEGKKPVVRALPPVTRESDKFAGSYGIGKVQDPPKRSKDRVLQTSDIISSDIKKNSKR